MTKKNRKTTIAGWVAAIGLLLASADSPISPLLPAQAKQYGTLAAVIGTMVLGQQAADKKPE
jgi:hypothetical protein